MGRLGLINQGFPWFIQISTYIFFSIAVVLLMQMISMVYHKSRVTVVDKNLCFTLEILLLLLVISFSAFRYISLDPLQFSGKINYYNIGGIDTVTYLNFYKSANDYELKEYINIIPMEKFYTIFFWVFSRLKFSYEFVLCLNYLIVCVSLIKFCIVFDLRKDYSLSLLNLMIILIQSYNTLRWSTSLILSIWIIDSILENKLFKSFILTIAFSLCFHIGSLSLLVPVFGFLFSHKLQNTKKIFLYFGCTFIGCIFVNYFPFEKIFGNSRLIYHIYSGGIIPLAWSVLYIFYIFNIFIFRKKYFNSQFRKKLFYICFFLMPLCLLEIKMTMMYRFSHFGHIITYFGLAEVIKVNKYAKLGIVFNGIIYLLLLLNILTFYGNDIISCGVPYIFGIYR